MKVVFLRPYKKWGDSQLIYKVFETYEALRNNQGNTKENMDICNNLILEAKERNLSCPKGIMYNNILFK